MNFNGATTDQNGSFIYFVYPFIFETANFQTLKTAISQAPIPTKPNQNLWESQSFPKDDLLFHVANYLNPTENHPPTASFWKLNEAARDILGFRAKWKLHTPITEIPFTFGEAGEGNKVIQLALFQIGVGFLTIRSQPDSDKINDWLNFLHYFRFLRGQQGTHVTAEKRSFDPGTKTTQIEPFFPELAGGNARYQQGKVCFGEAVTNLLKRSALFPKFQPEATPQQWWSEIFVPGQMLPFTALFADNLPAETTPHLLYKLQNLFHTKQGNNPAPEDLESNNPAWLPYANRQWFIFSLEGGSFLAADAPQTEFFRNTLPSHLRDQYFLLFLIALHQRFTLMMLSSKVALNWLPGSDIYNNKYNRQREQVFEEIRNQLLVFTARGYFTQVMQREHHHRCYRQWHQVFQIEQLYQEVNDEVRDMYEYALMQQTRRLETTIQVLGVAVGTSGIIASSIANYIQKPLTLKPSWNLDTIHPAVLVLLFSIVAGLAAGGLTWLGTGGWHWIAKRLEKRNKN